MTATVTALAWLLTFAQVDPAESWERRYEAARHELLVGHFGEGAHMFSALILDTDHGRRARATDAASLCSTWAAGGYRLVPPGVADDKGGENRRTLDELAVLYTTAVLYGVGSGVALGTWTEPGTP